MGYYAEEEHMLRCRKHPSKHRTTGVCPVCLRDRLMRLCPDCANVRPCACYPTTSSSSSSSSFSLSSSSTATATATAVNNPNNTCGGVGAIGRMSNLIDNEPSFQRSRSVAFPFLRSKISDKDSTFTRLPPSSGNRSSKTSSLWSSIFGLKKKEVKAEKQEEEEEEEEEEEVRMNLNLKSKMMMMRRSKSVGMADGRRDEKLKGRSWHFPSPIKAFRFQSKQNSKVVVQERSPLCRG